MRPAPPVFSYVGIGYALGDRYVALVDDGARATAASILSFLADLAPHRREGARGSSIPLEWFRWLPADAVRLFYDPVVRAAAAGRGVDAAAGAAPHPHPATVPDLRRRLA